MDTSNALTTGHQCSNQGLDIKTDNQTQNSPISANFRPSGKFLDAIASLQEGYGAKMSQMLSEHLDIIQLQKGHRCFLETEIVYNRKARSQMLYENMGAQWKG